LSLPLLCSASPSQFAAYGEAKIIVAGTRPMELADYFAAGALTGFTVAFVEAPIDLFKTQLQTQVFLPKAEQRFTTFLGTVSHITGTYGLRGCYQGLAPTIMRNVPAVSGYFGVYEWSRLALLAPGQKLDELESWKLLTAGSAGGLAYWAFTYPIDCIKSALQADACNPKERRFRGVADAAKQLWAEGGVPRFFKGVAPCVMRAAPANAVCFALYQKTAQYLGNA
jgi:solute carrier family 25 carnitine/acylcarnitine transporter 20/29